MRLILGFLALFVFAGCTATVCTLSTSAASAVAPVIASTLNCTGQPAIQKWLDDQLVKLNVCKAAPVTAQAVKPAVSGIATAVCQPLVDLVANTAVGTIPADWGCSGGALTDTAKAQLLAACQKAL